MRRRRRIVRHEAAVNAGRSSVTLLEQRFEHTALIPQTSSCRRSTANWVLAVPRSRIEIELKNLARQSPLPFVHQNRSENGSFRRELVCTKAPQEAETKNKRYPKVSLFCKKKAPTHSLWWGKIQ